MKDAADIIALMIKTGLGCGAVNFQAQSVGQHVLGMPSAKSHPTLLVQPIWWFGIATAINYGIFQYTSRQIKLWDVKMGRLDVARHPRLRTMLKGILVPAVFGTYIASWFGASSFYDSWVVNIVAAFFSLAIVRVFYKIDNELAHSGIVEMIRIQRRQIPFHVPLLFTAVLLSLVGTAMHSIFYFDLATLGLCKVDALYNNRAYIAHNFCAYTGDNALYAYKGIAGVACAFLFFYRLMTRGYSSYALLLAIRRSVRRSTPPILRKRAALVIGVVGIFAVYEFVMSVLGLSESWVRVVAPNDLDAGIDKLSRISGLVLGFLASLADIAYTLAPVIMLTLEKTCSFKKVSVHRGTSRHELRGMVDDSLSRGTPMSPNVRRRSRASVEGLQTPGEGMGYYASRTPGSRGYTPANKDPADSYPGFSYNELASPIEGGGQPLGGGFSIGGGLRQPVAQRSESVLSLMSSSQSAPRVSQSPTSRSPVLGPPPALTRNSSAFSSIGGSDSSRGEVECYDAESKGDRPHNESANKPVSAFSSIGSSDGSRGREGVEERTHESDHLLSGRRPT